MNDRILVVEDDDAIATGLALNLKLAGRTTSIARDGDAAIRQATNEAFASSVRTVVVPTAHTRPPCARVAANAVAVSSGTV